MPEPALGINFARDGMQRKDWLGLVAVHSDAWLLALAFYKGARLNRQERWGLDPWTSHHINSQHHPYPSPAVLNWGSNCCREELFLLINRQPTCYELVSGRAKPASSPPTHAPTPSAATPSGPPGASSQYKRPHSGAPGRPSGPSSAKFRRPARSVRAVRNLWHADCKQLLSMEMHGGVIHKHPLGDAWYSTHMQTDAPMSNGIT